MKIVLTTMVESSIGEMGPKKHTNKNEVFVKRALTQKEMERLVDFVVLNVNVPKDVGEAAMERKKLSMINQLKKIKLYPGVIDEMKAELERCYHQAMMNPGEAVGIPCSTYMAEIITQLTLNTFHFSGLSSFSVTNGGTHRLNELMNATKNIKYPTMIIDFDRRWLDLQIKENKRQKIQFSTDSLVEENDEEEKVETKESGSAPLDELKVIYDYSKRNLEEHTLANLLIKNPLGEKKIYHKEIQRGRKLTNRERQWYSLFFLMYSSDVRGSSDGDDPDNDWVLKFEWSIRMTIDKTEMLKRQTNLVEICERIELFRDLYCVCSSDDEAIIDVYVDVSNVEIPKGGEKCGITEENKDESFIRNTVVVYLDSLLLGGVDGIEMVYFQQEGNRWKTETVGGNFKEMMIKPEIKFESLYVNSIWQMHQNLGIEAARASIIIEMKKVIAGCNPCNIEILADSMTFSGTISSVSRYGIDKKDTSVITKASFEETMPTFLKAGINREVDDAESISTALALGKTIGVGSGSFDLLLQHEKVEEEKGTVAYQRGDEVPKDILYRRSPKRTSSPVVTSQPKKEESKTWDDDELLELLEGKSDRKIFSSSPQSRKRSPKSSPETSTKRVIRKDKEKKKSSKSQSSGSLKEGHNSKRIVGDVVEKNLKRGKVNTDFSLKTELGDKIKKNIMYEPSAEDFFKDLEDDYYRGKQKRIEDEE